MASWRCCCCPAGGDSRDPGRALVDHWKETCPGIPYDWTTTGGDPLVSEEHKIIEGEPPVCAKCAAGEHGTPCLLWVKTGRQVPDTDPYRDRTGWVAEWARCGCGCSEPTVPL